MNNLEKLKQLAGTKEFFSGYIFSGKKELPKAEYDILEVNGAIGVDPNTGAETPLVMFKLKNADMPKARWTMPMEVSSFF